MDRTFSDASSGPIGLLDIGSSKVVCLVVNAPEADAPAEIIGIGHQRSRGVTSGCVLDLDAAEESIRSAVSRAERMAGVQLDRVIATVSCGRLTSHRYRAHIPLAKPVSSDDVRRLHRAAAGYAERLGRRIVHWNRRGFRIDETAGIENPIGLAGTRLSGSYHAVTADAGAIDNIRILIDRCFLAPETLVPTPIASGFAVTTPEERKRGVVVVDIGAGTTGYARFHDGAPIDCGVIPFGGVHITYDITTAFGLSEREAERLKTLYSTLAVAPSDRNVPLDFDVRDGRSAFEEPPTRADLARIVMLRVIRQLALLRDRIAACPETANGPVPVVLTGGGALLPGIIPVVGEHLGRSVRMGEIPPLPGGAADLTAPQFAAISGLAQILGSATTRALEVAQPRGYVDRLQRWVLETF